MVADASTNDSWVEEYWPAVLQNHYSKVDYLPTWTVWLKLIFVPIIVITGIICNSLSFAVMVSQSLRKQTFSRYLAAIAISDTGVLLIRTLAWANFVSERFYGYLLVTIEGKASCVASHLLCFTIETMSAWLTATVTIERVIVVCFPFLSRQICSTKLFYVITPCLVMGIVLLHGYFPLTLTYLPARRLCVHQRSLAHVAELCYGLINEYIPACIIITCNATILYKLNRKTNIPELDHSKSANGNKITQRKRQITLMLCLLTMAFLIFTLPPWIMSAILDYGVQIDPNIQLPLHEFFEIMYHFNYACNFFFYVISGEQVRPVVKRLCCGGQPESRPGCDSSSLGDARWQKNTASNRINTTNLTRY
ncbi:FMRFamide receptor-like [Tubulanus polymorphus]|uniref:FMRFamide receptor-like n=1 Tax=Tubulanus polymorphus TaxID=672921 RepID=UPI003DA291CA